MCTCLSNTKIVMYMHMPAFQRLLCRGAPAVKLVEISADKGKPVVLRFSDDTTEQLLVCMDLVQAVSKLREAANCGMTHLNTAAFRRSWQQAAECHCNISDDFCEPP